MINKRRPRSRKSNTPPPPAVGERRASQAPIPPPPALPAEMRITRPAAAKERRVEPEEEREREEEFDESHGSSYEDTPVVPPVAESHEPPPAEDESEPPPAEESEPPPEEYAAERAAPREEESPAPSAPGTSTRWLPLVMLIVVAAGVALYVRSRRAVPPPRPAPPVPVASVSAPVPRVPVLSTAEPVIDRREDDASAVDMEAARSERVEAVRALEARNLPKALDLAEQAVAHDPANAEGWLILGATHIYRGDFQGSRNAFKMCVQVARVGRRDECAALLSQ